MGDFTMSKIKFKSIDIDFLGKDKNITIYLVVILFLSCLLISKLNLIYGSSNLYISDNILINGAKIGKAEVISDNLLKIGSCISGEKINPTEVVIHQTGCIDVDADKMYESLKNANNDKYAGTIYSNYRNASWTITVGYDKIIQNVPLNWQAYAQGTQEGNLSGISVEICMYTNAIKQRQAYLNAIELYKILKKYDENLNLAKHQDYNGKQCPEWLLEGRYNMDWQWFEEKCME